MKYTIPQLRAMPQINFMVNYGWMSKLTNEEIAEWEAEAIAEAEEWIKNDIRSIQGEFDAYKHKQEVSNIVNDKARILERDYKLLTIG
jgi:hypothetical protein